MQSTDFKWADTDQQPCLFVEGSLTLNSLPLHLPHPDRNHLAASVIIDFSKVTALDTSGAQALLSALRTLGLKDNQFQLKNINNDHENILKLVIERSKDSTQPAHTKPNIIRSSIEALGQLVLAAFQVLKEYISIVGQLCLTAYSYLLNPRKIRQRELFTQLNQTCLQAIPVVLLVNFLIGIVIAYLLAMQAEKYGAAIFVVDGVALAMCREMSPILVSIILAGRSGSAFTAQLGAMKLTEEIDAIKSIGLESFEVLIFPRIVALLIATPLLVFLGDIIGMYGGMLITDNYLHLSSTSFIQRLEQVLNQRHVLVGLAKAPAFALSIGVIACHLGLQVEKDARSVGLSTTKTVVRSIVIVILLNAAFTVLFAELGI